MNHRRHVEVLVVEDERDPTSKSYADERAEKTAVHSSGAVVARLHGFSADDQPIVSGVPELPGELLAARTTVPLEGGQVGCSVVLLSERGDIRRPIIIGTLMDLQMEEVVAPPSPEPPFEIENGRLVISAEREIVLRCGDATVTLTRAGKVLIQGAYVSTRSSGVNRIKGGSVQIN